MQDTVGRPYALNDKGVHNMRELIRQIPKDTVVTELTLSNPEIGDNDIAVIGTFFKKLKILNIERFRHFKNTEIEDNITGSTFDQLPASLEEFGIGFCRNLADKNIKKLQHLTRLKKLTFYQVPFTGSTFDELPLNLEELIFFGPALKDSIDLRGQTRLKKIICGGSKWLTGRFFVNLPKTMEIVDILDGIHLDELSGLCKLPNLKTLKLYRIGTSLKLSELITLKNCLPQLKIIFESFTIN